MAANVVRNRIFTNQEQVEADDCLFVDCSFRAVAFLYAGGEPPRFENCTFGELSWQFTGAALRTIQFLQFLNASPDGPAFIADMFQPGRMFTG